MEGNGIEEVEEILGLKEIEVRVGEVGEEGEGTTRLTLKPLSIKQQIAIGKQKFTLAAEASLAEAYGSASRGGYQGTKEELEELLQGDDLIRCEEAMLKLRPLLQRRIQDGERRRAVVQAEAMDLVIRMMKEREGADATSRVPTEGGSPATSGSSSETPA